MFDITSSKLLLLAIVALLVIGPKDFPALLRTIGKYVGIIRGHAREFRAQFDEAMRESELADLKKDVENIARETEASFQDTERTVEQTLDEARRSVDAPLDTAAKPAPDALAPADPLAHDANGLPAPQPQPAALETTSNALNGAAHEPDAAPATEPARDAAEGSHPPHKSGA